MNNNIIRTFVMSIILVCHYIKQLVSCVKTYYHPQKRTYTQCRQTRTTVKLNFVKFVHVVSEICEQTERQTDTLITINHGPPSPITK